MHDRTSGPGMGFCTVTSKLSKQISDSSIDIIAKGIKIVIVILIIIPPKCAVN